MTKEGKGEMQDVIRSLGRGRGGIIEGGGTFECLV